MSKLNSWSWSRPHQVQPRDYKCGRGYDVSNGYVRAPVTGLYSFSLTGVTNSNNEIYLGIVQNCVNLLESYSSYDYADSASITGHVHLNSRDNVHVENRDDPGSELFGGNKNCFSGILVTAD